MVRDLSDKTQLQRRLASRQRRMQAAVRQQAMAVDRGAFRVKSEEGLEVGTAEDPTGSEVVYGILRIIGQLLLEGDMAVTGGGSITVGGVVITPLGGGRIQIGPNIRLDSQTQRLTIGTGPSQIVLDLTQFKVGPAFRMDPAHSTTGAQQEFGPTGRATIYGGDDLLSLLLKNSGGSTIAGVSLQPNVGPIGTGPGVNVQGNFRVEDLKPMPSGETPQIVARSAETGLFHSYTGGTGGGPGDGIFAWPFPLTQVTSEFRSAARPNHDGIDFGIGPSNTEGTPIPSAGSGVVQTVGVPGGGHGWGYYVLVNHGADPLYGGAVVQTRYAHMFAMPAVSQGDPVTLGMTLGGIGNTGNSFGNHLHFEVLVDGVYVNPRTFMAAHGG